MTVTKKDLADHLADIRGLNTRGNKQLVKLFFNTIRESFRRPAKWSGYPAWGGLIFWTSGHERDEIQKWQTF